MTVTPEHKRRVLDFLTAVPEPASLSLTLLGLPFLRRRRTH